MADAPSLEQFIAQAKPLNPAYSDADLAVQYQKLYPAPAPSHEGAPPLDDFLKQAKPLNPAYSDDQLKEQYTKLYGEPAPVSDDGNFVRGAKVGMEQLLPTAKGAVGLLGATAEQAVGEGGMATAVKNWGLNGFKEGMAKIQPLQHENDELTTVWNKVTEHGDLGALKDFVAYGLGYGASQLAQSAVVGVAGAVAGSAIGGPAGTIPGAIAGVVEQTAAKGLIASWVEKAIVKRMAQGMGREAAVKSIGRDIGGLTAMGTFATGQEMGQIYPAAEDQATKTGAPLGAAEIARAWGASAVAGASELIPEAYIFGKALGRITGGPSRIGRTIAGGTTGAALEGGQEAFQTGVEHYGAGEPIADDAGLKDIINAAGLAIVGGGSAGATAGLVSPTPKTPTGSVEPILNAGSVDDAIAKAKRMVEESPITPEALDQHIADGQAAVDQSLTSTEITGQEAQHHEDQQALATVFGLAGETNEVTPDEAGGHRYQGAPLRVVSKTSLPDTTPPEGGLSKEKYDVLQALAGAMGKRIVFYEDQENLPHGVTLQSKFPSTIFMSNQTSGTDFFSVFAHEALHLHEGTEFHDAFRKAVWEQLTPESKKLALDRHGKTLTDDELLNEVTADIQGTELHKPEVWQKVYQHLQEKVGDEKAKAEVNSFIDTLKSIVAKIKDVIASQPWATTFNGSKRSIAEQYVKDLTKVHDALAAGVADAIYKTRTGSAGLQAEKGKLALSKKPTASAREIVHPETAKAFTALAQDQRGAPTSAMLKVQKTHGGGVLNPVVEHVGHLLHQMTEQSASGDPQQQTVLSTIDRSLRALEHAYGFEKEHHENLRNHARATDQPVDTLRGTVRDALLDYAKEHKKLPAYNLPHWLAREASVAVGEQRFEDAVKHLKELRAVVASKDYPQQAFEHEKEGYKKPLPAKLIGIQRGIADIPDFELYNLEEDIPGHPVGSTVSKETILEAGYRPQATDLISKTEAVEHRKSLKEIGKTGEVDNTSEKVSNKDETSLQSATESAATSEILPSVGHPLKFSKKLSAEDRAFAKEYDDAPLMDEKAKPAWTALKEETERLYKDITSRVTVEKVTGQPYPDADAMNKDIAKGTFKVTTDHSEHPVWSVEDNFKFRVVHDYLGHFETGFDFGMDGERQAYEHHAAQLRTRLAKQALKVEVYGQAAAGIAHDGVFQPQKIFIPSSKTVALEHYSSKEGLNEISPRFHGTGQIGAERTRMDNEGADYLPRSYFYRAGTKPESRFKGLTKYTANVPEDRLVDLNTLTGNPSEREREAKKQGYLGFYNSASSMPEAVALFGRVPVERPTFSKKQTETREFKKWFGDSKVVNEDGSPKVVYHGSKVPGLTEFKKEKIGSGIVASRQPGFWFAAKKEAAEYFADFDGVRPDEDFVTQAFLNIRNPLLIEGVIPRSKEFAQAHLDNHDGIIVRDVTDGDTFSDIYVVFEPTQIKSAIGNNGEFNPKRADIRFSPRIWFSTMGNILAEKMPANASKEQVQNILKSPGIKEDEIKWTGIQDYLDRQTGPIDKHNLLEWLKTNDVQVNEVVKRSTNDLATYQNLAQFNDTWNANGTRPDFDNVKIEPTPDGDFYQVHIDDQVLNMTTLRTQTNRESHDTLYRSFATASEGAYEYLVAEPNRGLLDDRYNGGTTQYEGYKLPGGEDYTELLLTLPIKDEVYEQYRKDIKIIKQVDRPYPFAATYDVGTRHFKEFGNTEEEARQHVMDRLLMLQKVKTSTVTFQSTHFNEPNIVAHVRFDTRKDGAGKSVLFLEEVQSDWHEQGREKGYQTKFTGVERKEIIKEISTYPVPISSDLWNVEVLRRSGVPEELRGRWFEAFMSHQADRVPQAPFSKSWPELVLKRMLRWASEHNYDRLAWTTGAQQNERYGLSKHVDEISIKITNPFTAANSDTPAKYKLTGSKEGRDIITKHNLSESDLVETIGKELTQKALTRLAEPLTEPVNKAMTPGIRERVSLSGIDLEVGGSGMKYFYDQMLPRFMEKYLKRFGTKVDALQIAPGLHPLSYEEWINKGNRLLQDLPDNEITRSEYAKYRSGMLTTVHSILLTPEMKDSVINQGQPKFSRRNAPSTYPVTPPGKLDTIIRTLQDKNIDTKRLVEDIQTFTNAPVPESLNPVLAEEMFQKRDEQMAKDFTNDELRPLIDKMRLNKITVAQMDEYLHAQHVIADQVNARLQAINPDLSTSPSFNKLSGITDAEAQAILAKAPPIMSALAAEVKQIVETTRDLMVSYGLETQARIDEWRKQYTHYVPLRREGFDEHGNPTGTGKSVRGSTVKQRGGSGLAVEHILANIAQTRDQIVTRGEKNRVTTAMAGLLMLHPNPAVATLDKPAPVTYTNPVTGLPVTVPGNLANYEVPTIRRFDPIAGTMKTYPDPMYKGRDNVVNFRVKGIDYAIVFHENNERAMEIAKAFKNLGTPQLNGIMKVIAPYTRYLAAINTQYNPIFGVVNFVRDAQYAMLTLSSTPLNGKQATVLANAIQALGGIYADARAIRQGHNATSATARMWQRFEHVGGPTGYRDLFFSAPERAQELERMMDPSSWKGTWNPQMLGKRVEETAMFKWLSDYNTTMENSIRLGVFKTAVDMGMSDLAAASLAKNITVNFNKKGQIGAQMGALYAFFNANVQGTARIAETLFERTPGGFRLSSIGKKIVTGGLLIGVLQTFALTMAGFDDDDPPEFVKQKNLVIPMPGTEKGYVMIPMPLGFNLLPNVGRLTAEVVKNWMQEKPLHVMDKMASLFGAIYGGLSPVGGTGGLITEAAPTVLDPFAALATNKDWTGKSISKEDHSTLDPTPGHTRAHDTATVWAKALSKGINWATGGTDYTPGVASPTPDAIDYLVQQATGGVGREVSKASQMTQSLVTGEELPTHKVPLLGRFVGSATGSSAIRTKFYENVKQSNIAYNEFEGRAKDHLPFSDYVKSHPEARFAKAAITVQKDLGILQKQKQMLLKQGASRDVIKLQEQRITGLMQRFNDVVEKSQATQ